MANGKDPNLGKPLIRITTDLKSLKYTLVSDTTGKTLGKDPYVTKSIPNHRVESTIFNGVETSELIVDPTPPAADGIIQSRVDDLTRFRKLALENPGQKFARNQAILGQNPLQIAKTAASILAQVPVSGTGTHFVNGFVVDTYLQKDAGQGTALGRFLASNLGINNLNGAGRALQGKQIITDNEGQKNYRSQSPSKLEGKNSKFDLTPGSDQDDFISPLLNQYLRSDIVSLGKTVANTIKGLFSKNETDKQAGKKPDLGNIFKASPDNLGQEGFRTEKEEDTFDYDSIKSNFKGPESPDKFVQSGFEDVEGRPLIKGTPEGENAKIISDNDGGRGFTPNAGSFLEKKESTQFINVEGEEKPLRPTITSGSTLLGKTSRESGLPVIPDQPAQADLFKLNFSNDRYAQYNEKYRLDNTFQRFPVSYSGSTGTVFPSYYRAAALVDQAQEGNIDGRTIVKGTPKGKNAKIIRDNPLTNGQAFNNDFVQYVGSINAEGQQRVDEGPSINPNISKDSVVNPPSAGRIIGSLGTEFDTAVEGFRSIGEDEEGNPVITQGENVDPGTVPNTNLKYFQDDYGEYDSEFDSNQISGPDGTGGRVTKLIDFRRIRKDSSLRNIPGNIRQGENGYDSKTDISNIDYATQDIEVRLGMANNQNSPKIGNTQSDFINSSDVQTVNDTVGRATREYFDSDIIPFEIISVTPQQQNFLYFRVFLDSLSDNYSGDWSGNKFIGRAEEFYTYQGFKRDISFSFKIAAFTKNELIPLYKKLNYLAATTAPTYNSAGSFMRGTLTEITLGDYLYRQEGFMSSIGLSWETGYPWEIDLDNEQLPKVPTILNVDCSFTPIHKFNATSTPNFRNEVYIGGEKLSV